MKEGMRELSGVVVVLSALAGKVGARMHTFLKNYRVTYLRSNVTICKILKLYC